MLLQTLLPTLPVATHLETSGMADVPSSPANAEFKGAEGILGASDLDDIAAETDELALVLSAIDEAPDMLAKFRAVLKDQSGNCFNAAAFLDKAEADLTRTTDTEVLMLWTGHLDDDEASDLLAESRESDESGAFLQERMAFLRQALWIRADSKKPLTDNSLLDRFAITWQWGSPSLRSYLIELFESYRTATQI